MHQLRDVIRTEVNVMKIGVLGTGAVGKANAVRLEQLDHDVCLGTQDVPRTMSKVEKDSTGGPPLQDWLKHNPKIGLVLVSEAAKHGEIVINAIKGEHSIEALQMAGEQNLNGKILIDISNPPGLLQRHASYAASLKR